MSERVSERLREAIERLFDDPSAAYALLGEGRRVVPDDWYEEELSIKTSVPKRARSLEQRLEKYVVQMSEESAEYGSSDETRRLRAEATGLLIALRELRRHFPEVSG